MSLLMMLPDIRRVRTDDMDAVERRSTVSVSWSHAGAVRERERAACASATQSQEGGVSDEEVADVRAGAERVRAQRPSDKVTRPSAAARSRPAPSVLPPPRRSDTAREEGEANARASRALTDHFGGFYCGALWSSRRDARPANGRVHGPKKCGGRPWEGLEERRAGFTF